MSVIDDEDSKIRRNLVAYSAAVIASAFFQVGFLDLIKEFVPSALGDIPAWKAIAGGLSVLIYLLVRYRWSDPYTERAKELHQHMAYEIGLIRQRYIARWVIRFNTRNSSRLDMWLFPKTAVACERLEKRSDQWAEKSFTLSRDTYASFRVGDLDKLSFTFSREYYGGSGLITKVDDEYVEYFPPRSMRLSEYLRVRFEAFIYSRKAVDIAVPQIFAGIAITILIGRLVCLYIE